MKKLIIIMLAPLLISGCLSTIKVSGLPSSSGGTRDIILEASRADKNSKAPTVLLAHGSGGVTHNNRDLSLILNRWGYNSVIIDHYTLRGIARHTGRQVAGARGEDRAIDIIEAARWVEKQEWHFGKIAVVGFSQGGGAVLTLIDDQRMRSLGAVSDAKPIPISASIAYYPSCAFNPVPRNPSMPTQVHLAEEDDLARPVWCNFAYTHENYAVHRYAGATHSFDENIPPGAVLAFTHRVDRKSTNLSREKVKEFLDKNLKQ